MATSAYTAAVSEFPPRTRTLPRDILALAERRDLGGMSFGFVATKEAWPARDKRTLETVKLLEISVVHAWPAYEQTSVSARARAMVRPAAAAHLRRLRLLELG